MSVSKTVTFSRLVAEKFEADIVGVLGIEVEVDYFRRLVVTETQVVETLGNTLIVEEYEMGQSPVSGTFRIPAQDGDVLYRLETIRRVDYSKP